MPIQITKLLSRFDNVDDRESDTALFRTRTPWIAPLAYLNIVFKPPPRDVLKEVAERIRMPDPLKNLMAVQNGAILFSGALSLYGVHGTGQLLNREDPFQRLPFNIEVENDNWPSAAPEQFLSFGTYGFDGSAVCINRVDSRIFLFRRGGRVLVRDPSLWWPTLNNWIENEIGRLGTLFDRRGRCLVEESQTLPQVTRPS